MKIEVMTVESPLGELWVASSSEGVCALGFSEGSDRLRAGLRRRFGAVDYLNGEGNTGVRAALGAYFSGEWDGISAVRLGVEGTVFQRRVWEALGGIPVGETRSYKDIAKAIGCPGGERAVGGANGANPVAILIPCHRVIASSGQLAGYGWGPERKAWLLQHEGAWHR